jgi:hypothetical protein
MEPILVPGPSKEAFNKHRRMSDLIRQQVNHFKHLEEKLPPDIRAKIPQHAIVTEGEAARYIGAMTAYFMNRPAPAQPAPKKTTPIKPPAAVRTGAPVALAAAAAPPAKKSASKKKNTSKKETPGDKESPSSSGKKAPSKRKK